MQAGSISSFPAAPFFSEVLRVSAAGVWGGGWMPGQSATSRKRGALMPSFSWASNPTSQGHVHSLSPFPIPVTYALCGGSSPYGTCSLFSCSPYGICFLFPAQIMVSAISSLIHV